MIIHYLNYTIIPKGDTMNFTKLPSNSEQILNELVHSDNPTQVLCDRFERASQREEDELNGIVRELVSYGYIKVMWADNLPYIVTLNNSARTYSERLSKHEAQKVILSSEDKETKKMIFISHRSTDKAIADMLLDFFSGTSIPRDVLFCSSLPGNDVDKKISKEVKTALQNSAVNIAILSKDYYQSAYCLNEAGVLWFQDDLPTILIALPEINSNNMYGFLSNEYKLRRLDSDTDISYIYDTVRKAVSAEQTTASIITYESNKLRKRYAELIRFKTTPTSPSKTSSITVSEITTDDERIILYYILQKNVRKVTKSDIIDWLRKNEIYDVNVDNAFDLLSSFDGGAITDGTLEFGIETFRKYSANASSIIAELKECVDRHVKLAVDSFNALWNSNSIDSITRLFIAYIIDERLHSFGSRWMSKGQIENIKQWESNNSLDSTLSRNYGSCLEFFIHNELVYESDWTSYDNPREYILYSSLQAFLFNCPDEIAEELQKVKEAYFSDLPF